MNTLTVIASTAGPSAGSVPPPWVPWGTNHRDGPVARALAGTPTPLGWSIVDPIRDGTWSKWAWTAPLTLSRIDAEAAGTSVPRSEDYVVVLRQDQGRWHAAVGVGKTGGQRSLKGSWVVLKEASEAGVAEARKIYRQEVDVIALTRGGLLTWGEPVALTLDDVTVIVPEKGQSAWNAYETRRGKAFAVISTR